MIALGIDPGQTGGLALVSRDPRGKMTVIDARMMPLVYPTKKATLDWIASSKFRAATEGPALVVIENVHSMPRQGVASSFQFGRMFGAVEMLAQAVPNSKAMYVSPATWKMYYGLGSAKYASIELATMMFRTDRFWKLKKHDGIAEAALLAAYGLEKGLQKMKCWHCGEELIWGGDEMFEDDFENEYLETNLSCSSCEALVLIQMPIEETKH